jgi:CBS-domain-containing membrane protein
MNHRRVSDVMTTSVVSVAEHTTFKEIADLLADHDISAVPVVDPSGRVLGVVSESDLLYKVAFADRTDLGRLVAGHLPRVARDKAAAIHAGSLMTAPATTITSDASVVRAARMMDAARVKRMPVVDTEGRLIGIVSRQDLLKVYLRSDDQIATDVTDQVLRHVLWVAPPEVSVSVEDGIVTLQGELDRRSLVPIAVRLTRAVDGVVDVVECLTYRWDDTETVAARRWYEPVRQR